MAVSRDANASHEHGAAAIAVRTFNLTAIGCAAKVLRGGSLAAVAANEGALYRLEGCDLASGE
jgi:hypothetical protein